MRRPRDMEAMARASLNEIDKDFGYFPGFRAAQAKGVVCSGTFTAAQAAVDFTTAAHFQPRRETPVIVRFANSATNPARRDGALDVRAMSVKFLLSDREQTDLTALRMSRFLVGTARQFLMFQRSISRNRWGDLPIPNWRTFLYSATGRLPLGLGWRQIAPLCRVPSYATCRYNSLHAFKWVNAQGEPRHVRYSWVPEVKEQTLHWWQTRGRDPNYLRAELRRRLASGRVGFRLEVTFAEPGDAVDDASALWPADRLTLPVGTLRIAEVIDDADGLRFDPTRVTPGIEVPEGDDLLQLRRHAYKLSADRRMDVTKPDRDEPPPTPPPETLARVNGIDIAYETFGDPGGRPLLLVMGFACPMTWWDPGFINMFLERNFHVVRFDNRDCGRSTRISEKPNRLVGTLFPRKAAPYDVDDMASDAAGLLDHLRIDAAHVMGVSLGGMIAQSLAIRYPKSVLSLTCISSNPVWRNWPPSRLPKPSVIRSLMRRPPRDGEDPYVEFQLPLWRLLNAGPLPSTEEEHVRHLLHQAWRWSRGVMDPAADFRQMLAVRAAADRTEGLGGLGIPACVIHGTEDPLIRWQGGVDTKNAIPGACFKSVDGMGHYSPTSIWDMVVDAVSEIALEAEANSAGPVQAAAGTAP